MLTQEQNDRLTLVGPGTPAGALLRHYWQPLCAADELGQGRKRVRILGEDLVVYQTPAGKYGCVDEHCPHRGASLFFGFIEEDGLRCCYHGWKFGFDGACLERPFEKQPPDGHRTNGYPVKELGGVLFVYMGPHPARPPLLPRWDVLARNDLPRRVRILPIHDCNWLQIQENTPDTVHTFYLHGHFSVVNDLPTKRTAGFFCRPIVDYDWKVSDWGIDRTLVYGGDNPEAEVRPPMIFPNILRTPEGSPDGLIESIHWRVPVDDTHTNVFWVGLMPAKTGTAGETTIEHIADTKKAPGVFDMSDFYSQDRAVWETQGAISDRTHEDLGASDRGIVMFRRMLEEQIDRVERGEDPTVARALDARRNQIIAFDSHTRRPEKHL
jgi:5,5'-dehydrodivanillate O-demethylase oxygenase subunit